MQRTKADMRLNPVWKRKRPDIIMAIDAIYEECDRLTKETGVKHEVDHIYPVNASSMCGLLVPWNMMSIPAKDNRRKSNRVVKAEKLIRMRSPEVSSLLRNIAPS